MPEKDPVVKVDKSGKIPVYTVRKVMSDAETHEFKGKFIEDKHFPIVLKESADVMDEEGNYIIRFRKDVLPKEHIDATFDALKEIMKKTTTDRGTASGSEKGLGTGQKNRIKNGCWCSNPRSANGYLHITKNAFSLFCWELICNGPLWIPRKKT